jgi:uncharacterized protein YndB with AHSA1/START domain
MEQPTFDVTVSREYAADPGTVFAAWLDSQNAARRLFATETGTMVRVEMDARAWAVSSRSWSGTRARTSHASPNVHTMDARWRELTGRSPEGWATIG